MAKTKDWKVLEPIKVGPMELKNRVQYLAMARGYSNPDNTVGEQEIAYFERVAEGGTALIATGACIVFQDYPSQLPCQPGLYDEKFIPGLRKLSDAVHKHGAKILFQPWHPGKINYGCDPSQTREVSDFSIDEIKDLQRRFVESAVIAQKGGADGIEVHIAHNYLNEQFLVPLFNKRTDEYGAQTMENGLRFSTEIIKEVKKVCGPDFAVTCKINGTDLNPEGMTAERVALAGPILEAAGADMIAVSGGGGLTNILGMSGDGYFEEGWKVPFAEAVKENVSIPVQATGSIRHPEYVEQLLAEGKCDMVGMGRGLFADPDWVNKLSEGREDEVRFCISCNECFVNEPGKSGCSVNPLATRELEHITVPGGGDGRTVAVVGGGPAGMQAAMTLAERGFKPVLFEKGERLGGIEYDAALPVGKSKLMWHIDYLERQLKRLNVDVRLGEEATADKLEALKPYAVFTATGSDPIIPRFAPGWDKPHVIEACELLNNLPDVSGQNVVIIGAGLVGIETGSTLVGKGAAKVTLVDMLPPYNPAAMSMDLGLALGHALAAGVQLAMGHKLLEITDDAVIAENTDTGEKVSFPADRVVLAMGRKAQTSLYEEIKDKFERVINIGDSKNTSKILHAVQTGFDSAAAL